MLCHVHLNYHPDILVGMLKKEKKRTADLEMSARQGGGRFQDGTSVAADGLRRSTSQPLSDDSESELSNLRSASRARVKDRPSSDTTEVCNEFWDGGARGVSPVLVIICFHSLSFYIGRVLLVFFCLYLLWFRNRVHRISVAKRTHFVRVSQKLP